VIDREEKEAMELLDLKNWEWEIWVIS